MKEVSPYENPAMQRRVSDASTIPRSTFHWMLVGSLIAATVPLVAGGVTLYNESVYSAALPPGTGACGMGVLAGLILIVIGGPVFGLVGGGAGWLLSKVRF
jgi:hypothetical protein